MKRDPELLRLVMLKAEELDHPEIAANIEIEGYAPDAVDYHARLLVRMGLLEGRSEDGLDVTCTIIDAVTPHGHDFLEAAHSPDTWRKTLADLAKGTGQTVVKTAPWLAALRQILGF